MSPVPPVVATRSAPSGGKDCDWFSGIQEAQECYLLGGDKTQLVHAHIIPKSVLGPRQLAQRNALIKHGFVQDEAQLADLINATYNWLVLPEVLEEAFDSRRLCFVPALGDDARELKLKILDPDLLDEVVLPAYLDEASGKVVGPLLARHYDNRVLLPSHRIWTRALALHALFAHARAHALRWIAEDVRCPRFRSPSIDATIKRCPASMLCTSWEHQPVAAPVPAPPPAGAPPPAAVVAE